MTDTIHTGELATCDFCRAEAPVRRKYLYRENKEREIGDGFTITRYCHECGLKSENANTIHTDNVEAVVQGLKRKFSMNRIGEILPPGETVTDKVAQAFYEAGVDDLQAQTSQQVEEAVKKRIIEIMCSSGFAIGYYDKGVFVEYPMYEAVEIALNYPSKKEEHELQS